MWAPKIWFPIIQADHEWLVCTCKFPNKTAFLVPCTCRLGVVLCIAYWGKSGACNQTPLCNIERHLTLLQHRSGGSSLHSCHISPNKIPSRLTTHNFCHGILTESLMGHVHGLQETSLCYWLMLLRIFHLPLQFYLNCVLFYGWLYK